MWRKTWPDTKYGGNIVGLFLELRGPVSYNFVFMTDGTLVVIRDRNATEPESLPRDGSCVHRSPGVRRSRPYICRHDITLCKLYSTDQIQETCARSRSSYSFQQTITMIKIISVLQLRDTYPQIRDLSA